jgi:hypothetical protein
VNQPKYERVAGLAPDETPYLYGESAFADAEGFEAIHGDPADAIAAELEALLASVPLADTHSLPRFRAQKRYRHPSRAGLLRSWWDS